MWVSVLEGGGRPVERHGRLLRAREGASRAQDFFPLLTDRTRADWQTAASSSIADERRSTGERKEDWEVHRQYASLDRTSPPAPSEGEGRLQPTTLSSLQQDRTQPPKCMDLRLASYSKSLAQNMSTRSTRSRAIATSPLATSSTALATSPSIPLKREAPTPPPSSSSTPKKARTMPSKRTTPKFSTTPSKGNTPTPKKFAAYLTTPFPDYARPTADECEEVTRLLGAMHGLPQRPGRVEKLPEDGTTRVGEACEFIFYATPFVASFDQGLDAFFS